MAKRLGWAAGECCEHGDDDSDDEGDDDVDNDGDDDDGDDSDDVGI